MIAKIVEFCKKYHTELTWSIITISITIISFNLGRASAEEESGRKVSILSPSDQTSLILNSAVQNNTPKEEPRSESTQVVASKKSTSKAYHYSWCSGAKLISEKNKVIFNTPQEAERAGYTLAGNCKP